VGLLHVSLRKTETAVLTPLLEKPPRQRPAPDPVRRTVTEQAQSKSPVTRLLESLAATARTGGDA